MCLPEAKRDVRLLDPEQISDRERGKTQEAPLRQKQSKTVVSSHIKLLFHCLNALCGSHHSYINISNFH